MTNKERQKFIVDKFLLLILCTFAVVSLIAIVMAEPIMSAYLADSNLWLKQAMWFGVGAIAVVIILMFGVDRLFSSIKVFYWILMILLFILVLDHYFDIIPNTYVRPVNGTTAWYFIPYLGSFQPSEFMKIVLIIMSADIIYNHNQLKQEMTFTSDILLFLKILLVAIPPLILIFLQPDTGIPIIICVSLIAMLCVSGIRHEWFFMGVIVVGAALVALVGLYYFNQPLLKSLFGGGYKLNRIYGWLDAEYYSNSHGLQLYTSLLTLGSSGLTGTGGVPSVFIRFPEPQTDFILSVIGQSFGLLGTGTIVVLSTILDLKLCNIAIKYEGEREKYLVAGLLGMLLFQQFQNMGMIVGLLPITGITLPFVSYGGSSMISYMIPLAIVFWMSNQTKQKFKH